MSHQAENTAKNYYDSEDADNFYYHIWGGEDIHIGLYLDDNEPIRDASRRTVEKISEKLTGLGSGSLVADLGAGFGGAARYLVEKFGCRVDCVNISPVENERNRTMNEKRGFSDKIRVFDASFEEIPLESEKYDFAWSQDAILHSGNRKKVLEEVYRILKPGGVFIFTDPMRSDNVNPSDIQPVLERIHLSDMGSFDFYRTAGEQTGFQIQEIQDLSNYLPVHYGRVRQEIINRYDEIKGHCSVDYLERMKMGLEHWVNAGKAGKLTWGILILKKP